MKRKNKLLNLYLAYHLNKSFIILLFVLMVFLIGVIFINMGLPLDNLIYYEHYSLLHTNYIRESFNIVVIINIVLISFLIGNEINSISSFDPMFVSNIKRSKIIFSKILTNLILMIIIILFEFILIFMFGVIFFPNFKINFIDLKIILYLFLQILEITLIGEILIIIFNNYFISIFMFLLNLILIILSEVENVKNIIYLILPIINIDEVGNYILNYNPLIYISLIILFYTLNIILYQKKDIKT